MKPFRSAFLSVVTLTLLSAFLPSAVLAATDIIVNGSDTNCSDSLSSPTTTHCTIQGAIDTAVTNTSTTYSVLVEPGTYNESITLQGISLHGRETARTILTGSVTVDTGTASTLIYNLTFNGSSGISITGSASATISNNIFYGQSTTGIDVTSTSSGFSIDNNVFYSNATAISSSVDLVIYNNIFLSNSTAISSNAITSANVTYNDFRSNGDDSTWSSGTGNITTDPAVVDATLNDFHLTSASPCIGVGSSGYDMGAYGGMYADTIMFQIQNLDGTIDSSTNVISLTWSANNDYKLGGYKVYYGTSSGDYTGTGASEGNSPIEVGTSTSATLSNLPASATPLDTAPTVTVSDVQNQSLTLTWDAIDGATGYLLYYDVDDGTTNLPTTSIDVGNTTSYTLTGLTNNVNYKIVVYAYSQAAYYITVTAIDNVGPTFVPGIEHESAYSAELTATLGSTEWSPVSNMIVDFPEALVSYPNLPDKGGCFIATAAYGSYSAPQVQLLRSFRDRYLASSSAGRAFIRFYYAYSPAAAAWLNDHPGLKPVVRAGLMPFIGAAYFLTRTSLLVKLAALLMVMLVTGIALLRRRMSAPRAGRPE